MKKILSKAAVEDIYNLELEEVIKERLNAEHDLPRGRAVILIGFRLNEDYSKYSQLLFDELDKKVHFLNVRLGIKSAWVIILTLIENLKEEDYPKVKKAFDKWDKDEKESFLDWLSDFPEHCSILKDGKLNN